jgi:bacterioferritin-associated ferredoxin
LVVCSCNQIDTNKIKAAVNYVTEPNERMVLNMLNWQPDCSVCTKVLIEEIRRVMKEVMDGR